ncbi:hypothetical protein V494_08533 [Pseudogymnoascus sp. VKM F-4513 (FW-928)]|nr:hypothetical protein V494_08533 [Pseudogymnoascus sp. VKM F-4513 (FW-928)]
MPPSEPCPEGVMPGIETNSGHHGHHSTVQDSGSGESMASFMNNSVLIESLDELLAGESEIPTTKSEPYDNPYPTQEFPTVDLDPVAVENAQLEYEKYMKEMEQKPAPTPRIERVNEPGFFIGKGVVTGTSYPLIRTPPETPRRQPRNGPPQNSFIPDYNCNTTIWETREERLNAIDHQNVILNPRARLSEYFVWGISYNPPEQLSQGHRAVHISVPVGTSLKSILDNINTGLIYSATLCNTAAITGELTAFIVFVDESGASQLKSSMASKYFNPVHITSNPTWPINESMLKQIRQGWTRCLSISGLPSTLSTGDVFDMIVQPRYSQVKEVLELQCYGQGVFRVEFSSIPAADKVFKLVSSHYRGSDVAVSFASDPCSPGGFLPYAPTPDHTPTTLTPSSSFGSQDSKSIDNKASFVANYGLPPVFSPAGALPEVQKQRIVAASEVSPFTDNTQPSASVGNQDASHTSSTRADAHQYMAAAALMEIHGEDASLAAQDTKADTESARELSNLLPTFEYHGTGLNWADEMIEEAADEECKNPSALDILAHQALSRKVF